MNRIYIHLGLPKCASTVFQNRVFPCLNDVTYIRKRNSVNSEPCIVKEFTKYIRSDPESLKIHAAQVYSLLDPLFSVNDKILISNEGISLTAMDIWNKTGIRPQLCSERLRSLSESLGVEINIMFFTRDIASWFVSRYAQSAPFFEQPCQSDFNKRLEILESQTDTHPSLSWLNECLVKDCFSCFSFHPLRLSQLEQGGHEFIKSFLNSVGLAFDPSVIENIDLSQTRSRKLNQFTWELRDSNNTITYPPEAIIKSLIEKLS